LNKQQLRRELSAKRSAISKKDKRAWDAEICEAVLAHKHFLACKRLLGFYPIGSEPDIRPVLEKALELGKAVYLPCCKPQLREMIFRQINSLSELVPGAHGIPEPAKSNDALRITHDALCLVPGLAFDENGFRLGYGGGYYDRFLEHFEGSTLGICHRILRQAVPVQAHDLPVDEVIFSKETT